jgi:hypothetical protein
MAPRRKVRQTRSRFKGRRRGDRSGLMSCGGILGLAGLVVIAGVVVLLTMKGIARSSQRPALDFDSST